MASLTQAVSGLSLSRARLKYSDATGRGRNCPTIAASGLKSASTTCDAVT